MSKLNPFYILALVLTLFVVSYFSLSKKENEFSKLSNKVKSIKVKAEDFKEYKKTWFNKSRVLKKIDLIVQSSVFKKEKILKTENSNLVRIKISSSNPKILNRFLNRFLNEKLIIKKLDLKKDSILLEIGFQ